VGFVRRLDRAIIDEVQRPPELLLALKLSIDNDWRVQDRPLAGHDARGAGRRLP
jgi:hypothetical protein